MWTATAAVLMFAVAVDAVAAPQRLPIPDKATRDEKRKEILSIFPPSEARTFAEKGDYATQLIRTAGDSTDDPPAQFALLNLAREQAAEAGHIKLALAATDELEKVFEFDAAAVRVASLQQASRAALSPAAKREIVVAGYQLINQLAAADQFEDIDVVSDRIMTLARPLRDAVMIKEITDQRRAVDDRAAAYRKAEAAFATLKRSPADAGANLAAGHYLVFAKHDWPRGLEHLARGSDAALAAAAKSELAAPAAAADREKLGDAWWDAAIAQKDETAKLVCRAQAVDCYRQVLGGLVGLAKVRLQKRIEEAGDLSQVATRSSSSNVVSGGSDVFGVGDVPSTDPSPSPSPAPAEPEFAYLDDMIESASQVGLGKLGKRGADDNDGKVKFEGKLRDHAIYMHAKKKDVSFAKFQLDNNYETFTATAGIMEPYEGELLKIESPLTFSVIGDGKVLWKSSPLQRQGDGQPVKVNVRNVAELSLQVDCPGGMGGGAAIWVDPLLTRKRQPIINSGKKLTVVKHTWHNGEPLVKLAPVAEAFCFFTNVGGNLAGFGEDLGVAAGSDGNWYLGGTSAQGLGMSGVIITGDLRKEFEPICTKYDWTKDQPPVKMIHSRAGICFLSRVAGAFDGEGEAVRVYINPKDGFWYMDGVSNRAVAATALALRLRRNARVKLECTEHECKLNEAPQKLIAADEGFAYLSGIMGDFAGGGEWVNVELVDGFWQFSGQTQKPLGARAISVRVK